MSRLFPHCLICLFILASCGNDLKDKDKVQAAILDRLRSHSGLDLKSMDVSTTDVSFENNMAYATVAFHPKGDPNLKDSMSMKYTLEARDGKWVVAKVGGSAGHSIDQGATPANPHLAAPPSQ